MRCMIGFDMETPLSAALNGASAPRRRVVIVDDHDFFAACLRALLDDEPDLMVCDVASGCIDLEHRVSQLNPDLLVIDISLGTENGLEVARRLRAEYKIETPILFVSTLGCPSPAQLAAVRRCAFVPKTKRPSQFLTAVRVILTP
jgi:DNA-binding NarL/FixJ family response regulator